MRLRQNLLSNTVAESMAVKAWSNGDREMAKMWFNLAPEKRRGYIEFVQEIALDLVERGWKQPKAKK